jgi:cell division protein FtsB
MLFFDSNDILTQIKLSSKQKDLQKTKDFYIEKIDEVKEDREALLNNEALLEKVARERYYMKKSNEDVYVIVEKEK